jgi:hypothetical protein
MKVKVSNGLGIEHIIETSYNSIPKIEKAVMDWKFLNFVSDKKFGKANRLLGYLKHRNVKYNIATGKPNVSVYF